MPLTEKRCKNCQRVLPIEHFDKNQYNKAGEVIRRSECRECRKDKKSIPSKVKRLYEKQNPRPQIGDSFYCPICQRTMIVQKNRDVNIDHDHATGEIRGYVCNDCNTGLGKFRDDISIIERAIRWLKGTLSSFI